MIAALVGINQVDPEPKALGKCIAIAGFKSTFAVNCRIRCCSSICQRQSKHGTQAGLHRFVLSVLFFRFVGSATLRR